MQRRRQFREVLRLRVLPPHVAWFQWRARRRARALGDTFALESSTRPADLARLLELARGRRRVVELGTANGWTAIALALDDPRRPRPHVRSLRSTGATGISRTRLGPGSGADHVRHGAGERRPSTASRAAAAAAQAAQPPHAIELLYIDSSHDRDDTIAEVRAWQGALAPGALIVFDDYTHPEYPGVREAVAELGLSEGRRAEPCTSSPSRRRRHTLEPGHPGAARAAR